MSEEKTQRLSQRSGDDERLRLILQERFERDHDAGGVHPLAHYQALFPDYRVLVEQEYRRFHEMPVAGGDPGGLSEGRPEAAGEAGRAGAAPTHVGPFRLVEPLGSGGQGVVYLAEDRRFHQRRVALKLLPHAVFASSAELGRFRREAHLASSLNHPAICPVLDAGTDESGVHWIAMRYVEGEPLSDWLKGDEAASGFFMDIASSGDAGAAGEPDADLLASRRGPALRGEEVGVIVRYFSEVALALHAVHEVGIVHRDIKPHNLMVTAETRPVILDFGLARGGDCDLETLTRSGAVMGTPAYMSPEQVRGERADRRSDVFSIGVSLYEALTRSRPFEGSSEAELYEQIQTKIPIPAHRRRPGTPQDLSAILEKAMAKDLDHRYLTALAFHDDLERFLNHQPVLARRTDWSVRGRLWVRRNPGPAALLLGAFLLLGASVFFIGRILFHLGEYDRLADLKTYQDLQARLPSLRAVPEDRAALRQWTLEAKGLVDRVDRHREDLGALRDRGEHVAAPRAPRYAGLERRLRDQLAPLREEFRSLESMERSSPGQAQRGADLDVVIADLGEIEELVASRAGATVVKLDEDKDQFRHDALDELIAGVETLRESNRQGIPYVEGLLRRADEIAAVVASAAEGWDAAIRAINADPKYGGLKLERMPGMIPIGRDPESGLWEFCDLQSGDAPRRDDGGRCILREDSGMVFVLVPGGEFRMGSPPDAREMTESLYLQQNEVPQRRAVLGPFLISKFEVTQAQWLRVTGGNPSSMQRDARFPRSSLLHPVESVSWEDAVRAMERLGLRLPTEAQWEYACRAGSTTWWFSGDTSDSLRGHANLADQRFFGAQSTNPDPRRQPWKMFDDGHAGHAPVGCYAANAFGLHDMAGNVQEFCSDEYAWYQHALAALPGDGLLLLPGRDPYAANPVARRPVRGGGWRHHPAYARCAFRVTLMGLETVHDVGLRPVLSLGMQ